MFHEIFRGIFYDYLYRNQYLDLGQIDSLYRVALYNKGISDVPVLMIWDKASGDNLRQTDTLTTYQGYLFTQPIDIGYECEHQVVAAFRESGVFYFLGWHLLWEGIFMVAFVVCLVWQWWSMKTTWHNARVQTQGMAHLEHELRKPLATMISTLDGILSDSQRELTDIKLKKLGMMKARLLKMSDVTDTMLATMKTDRLEVEREPLDIQKELEQVEEMFKTIRSHAEVHFRIQECLKYPLLDRVYFNYVVINLVDNGIKYAGEKPVVYVDFREEGSEYVLVVTDNGIGMPRKALKRIFSQFYRVPDEQVAKLSGFGLGLAFVRKVVVAYGGRIKVESEAGVGSRFTIFIPSHQNKE
ncbi:MAG: HAMP domain-containing histidine kinase [Odoribacter sp.]|nr:HAMP domain-containing histidine kinase [Odoribacter sp.]